MENFEEVISQDRLPELSLKNAAANSENENDNMPAWADTFWRD